MKRALGSGIVEPMLSQTPGLSTWGLPLFLIKRVKSNSIYDNIASSVYDVNQKDSA